MEYSLRPIERILINKGFVVLILILMEYSLRLRLIMNFKQWFSES